jgi:hypothetical protein
VGEVIIGGFVPRGVLQRADFDAVGANSPSSQPRSAATPVAVGTGQRVNQIVSYVGMSCRARFALAVRATPEVLPEAKIPWVLGHARACVAAIQVHLLFPGERPGEEQAVT